METNTRTRTTMSDLAQDPYVVEDAQDSTYDNEIAFDPKDLPFHARIGFYYTMLVLNLRMKTGIHSPYPFHAVFLVLFIFILLKLKKLVFR